MPKPLGSLLSLRAAGKIGGSRRRSYDGNRPVFLQSFTPSKDNSLSAFQPALNFGSSSVLFVDIIYAAQQKTIWRRSLLTFDLSLLHPGRILAASLTLEITGLLSPVPTLRAARLTRPHDWLELSSSWNNYRTAHPWSSPGGDFTTTRPPHLTFAGPTTTGPFTIQGFAPLVLYAVAEELAQLAILITALDEDPDSSFQLLADSREGPTAQPRLDIAVHPV